jgi:hypothetical protein
MTSPRIAVAAAFLLAAACATPVEMGRSRDHREQALRAFQDDQAVFRSQYTGRHQFDFDGHGRVTVRDISLDGFPGNTYVRCRFHYQNRTRTPVVQTWISLDILDADGGVVASQSVRLVMPTSTAIARGSYFSEELRTPTYDAHREPGWSWRIRCQSDPEVAEEPLDPPVPEQYTREPSTFLIKDRNWPYVR